MCSLMSFKGLITRFSIKPCLHEDTSTHPHWNGKPTEGTSTHPQWKAYLWMSTGIFLWTGLFGCVLRCFKRIYYEVFEEHMPSVYCNQTLFTRRYQYSSTIHSVERLLLPSDLQDIQQSRITPKASDIIHHRHSWNQVCVKSGKYFAI